MLNELDLRVYRYSEKLENLFKGLRGKEVGLLEENERLREELIRNEKKHIIICEKYAEERGSLFTKLRQIEDSGKMKDYKIVLGKRKD